MELTATAVQTVASNSIVNFTATTAPGSPSILHMNGSGLVTLRGLTNQWRARFVINASANVALSAGATATEPINLSIALNGEPLTSTTMISTPGVVEEFNNVARSVTIDVARGCCVQISLENTGTTDIDVQNVILNVERVA